MYYPLLSLHHSSAPYYENNEVQRQTHSLHAFVYLCAASYVLTMNAHMYTQT
jgi:TRAP-type mannitol/chloroaromatic compound transport system permease small subunit